MITGKTKSGFEYSIPDGLTEDFRFVVAYKKIKSGDGEEQLDAAISLVSVVFSNDEEEKRFYEHLASVNGGRVPAPVLYQELFEIVSQASEQEQAAKNS